MQLEMTSFIQKIVNNNPLINCLTNMVTVNFQANALLAIGASPIMTDEPDAAPQVSSQAQAVVINIGSPFGPNKIEAIKSSLVQANQAGVPVVIDPVGISALDNRLTFVKELLTTYKIEAVVGNYSEIAALAGVKSSGKGVDGGQPEEAIDSLVTRVANTFHTIVVATGKTDVMGDGERIISHSYGHKMMGSVTGTGCVATTMVAAFISQAQNSQEALEAASLATAYYAWCGGKAVERCQGPGDLPVHLLNYLYTYSVEANNHDTSEIDTLTIQEKGAKA